MRLARMIGDYDSHRFRIAEVLIPGISEPSLCAHPIRYALAMLHGSFAVRSTLKRFAASRYLTHVPHIARVAANLQYSEFQRGIRAMTLISKSNPASQLTPIAVQFG